MEDIRLPQKVTGDWKKLIFTEKLTHFQKIQFETFCESQIETKFSNARVISDLRQNIQI